MIAKRNRLARHAVVLWLGASLPIVASIGCSAQPSAASTDAGAGRDEILSDSDLGEIRSKVANRQEFRKAVREKIQQNEGVVRSKSPTKGRKSSPSS
jgi:hypothetical protein